MSSSTLAYKTKSSAWSKTINRRRGTSRQPAAVAEEGASLYGAEEAAATGVADAPEGVGSAFRHQQQPQQQQQHQQQQQEQQRLRFLRMQPRWQQRRRASWRGPRCLLGFKGVLVLLLWWDRLSSSSCSRNCSSSRSAASRQMPARGVFCFGSFFVFVLYCEQSDLTVSRYPLVHARLHPTLLPWLLLPPIQRGPLRRLESFEIADTHLQLLQQQEQVQQRRLLQQQQQVQQQRLLQQQQQVQQQRLLQQLQQVQQQREAAAAPIAAKSLGVEARRPLCDHPI
ncbi:hypothetical protein Efla_001700 [Eimeria flavescens]